MKLVRRVLSRVLLLGGVLLLAKGSFSVYPFLIPAPAARDEAGMILPAAPDVRFQQGSYLFRLSFPRQRAAFDVVEGTTEAALRRGPGHLTGTPLPGTQGNSVIAGHRDTHFRVLKDIAIGDEIRAVTNGKLYAYRVVEARIVSPQDTSALRPESGSVITLVTCYPFYFVGPAPDRFIVRARTITPLESESTPGR